MRILVVEDEVNIRLGLSKLITSLTKHQVIGEAKNGITGLEMVGKYQPDLIITDIRMPEMDGLSMLRTLSEKEIPFYAVILSGYAEFDYAKQAIALGVTDYLLKPIGVDDVLSMLEKIDAKITKDKTREKGPEQLIRNLYTGEEQETDLVGQLELYLNTRENPYCNLYLGYVGCVKVEEKMELQKRIHEMTEQIPQISSYLVMVGVTNEIIIVVLSSDQEGQKKFLEQFERKIVKRHFTSDSETVWGLHSSVEIKDLGEVVKDMHEDLSYEMVLPKQTLITKERIKNLKFEKYQYPEEIERKIYHAICDENKDKLKEQIDKFKGYFKEHIIQPKQIRHMYLKMVSSIMNVVQEMDGTAYGKLQELSSFSYISNVRTSHELEQHLDEIAAILQSDEEKKEDIHNYTIKRAINYIREHYQEAITLDALADKLEITPEYLSTLFNREVEINFTTFLKRFRISHAKRLLKTTDLKVYEIAKMVGYADPKYFIRVFKEVQGASPKEFRLKK